MKGWARAVWVALVRVGWLPVAVFAVHEVCAHVVDGYRLWPSVDIPLHFAGGFAIAFFVSGTIGVFSECSLIRRPDAIVWWLLVFCASVTTAVFWEFAEWCLDRLFGTQCQLGLDDTILDLLMGAIGGGVFCVWLIGVSLRRLKRVAFLEERDEN